jgi:hypothetical protein
MATANAMRMLEVLNVVRPRLKSGFRIVFCAAGSGKRVLLEKSGEEIYIFLDEMRAGDDNTELWDAVDVLLKRISDFRIKVAKYDGKIDLCTDVTETNDKIVEAVDAIFIEGYGLGRDYELLVNP